MRRLLLMILSLLLLVAACDSGQTVTEDAEDADVEVEADESDETEADETDTGEPGEAQATFAAPADGDVVQPTFAVQMEATGVEVVPADASEAGQGHFHIVVDAGCVEDGEAIPGPGDDAQADGYYHFGDGSSETELELEPGTYELCLQLGDGQHHAFGGTDVIEVTVTSGRG